MSRILAGLLLVPVIATAQPSPLDRISAGVSASVVLGEWCDTHGLPPLRAERLPARRIAPDATILAGLKARSSEPVGHRKVRLTCGGRTLSVADNWYLPDRLTPEMNRRLANSDVPFGFVVRPLAFRRRTLGIVRDPAGSTVRAVLIGKAGAPFSYVVERYDTGLR